VRIVFATTNEGKAREVAAILAEFGVEVERPGRLPPVEEDGTTFAENARKKAASAARATGRFALAEDSGLVVPALGGEPGVRSARYAGPGATDAGNVARLLEEVSSRGLVDPPAAFVCRAVVARPDGTPLFEAEGSVHGVVRGPPRGRNGFGYDPVFHWSGPGAPEGGARFAELPPERKNAVSHRAAALRAIGHLLESVPFEPPADGA
jgi:XTP/dITP diphosphohydrolase